MTITPVVPVNGARLVVEDQSIIIDSDNPFNVVRVYVSSWVEVWDDGVGFQNGWSGSYITHPGGYRLVLDPPSPFPLGTPIYVNPWASPDTIDYTFYVGLERLTTESDLSAPQVVKVDSYVWSARVHNNEDPGGLPPQFDGPGNVYLQVLDPRGGEVLVVPGDEVGLVWDEGRNKVIIYFIRNETVFFMEADPSDTPTTQSQLRSLETTVRAAFGGEGLVSHADASFPPIKLLLSEAVAVFNTGGEGAIDHHDSPYNSAPTPNVISGALDGPPVVLRIQRPSSSPEADLLKGFYVVKFLRDTPSIIGYIEMAPDDAYVQFEDSCLTPGAKYAVMPLYHLWAKRDDDLGRVTALSYETRRESWGGKASIDPYSLSELIEPINTGGEGAVNFSYESFPPNKVAIAQDVFVLPSGGEGALNWVDSSFDPIGT